MPLERQQSIVGKHAAAVIGHPDQAPAAGFDIDAKLARARVQRVLEQFFHHTGRPLDDLSGRDFVRDGVREDADTSHGGVS